MLVIDVVRYSEVRAREWRGHLFDGLRNRRYWLAVVLCMALLGTYNAIVYHPHLDQPHRLAILAMAYYVGLAAIVVYCGTLLGLWALRALRIDESILDTHAGERIALATGIGLGGLSLLTLAAGAVHLYYGATFAVLLAVIPLLLRPEADEAANLLRDLLAPLRGWRLRRGDGGITELLLRAAMVLVCLGVAVLMLLSDMIPPGYHGYDTYQYHWAVPVLLLRAHGWIAFPGWAHANLPFATEMLNLIALSLGAPQAATVIQDAFLLLIALLIYAVVSRLFGRTTVWLAVLAVVTIPILLVYSDLSFVESALIFYGIAAMVVLFNWLERALQERGDALNMRILVLAGIYIGLALSVKYIALEYIPAAAVMLLIGLGLYIMRVRPLVGRGRAIAMAGCAAIAFAVAAIGPLGPWLLKDWILVGDPIYPALPHLFATPEWDTARTATLTDTFANFGVHNGILAQLHLYVVDMFLNPVPYGEGMVVPVGSLAATCLLIVPCTAFTLGRRLVCKRWPSGQATLLVAVLGLWTISVLGMWTFSGALVERYALPGIALATLLGAVLIGSIVGRIPVRLRILQWPFVLILSALCLAYATEFLFPTFYFRNPWPVISGSVSEQSYFRANVGPGLPRNFFAAVDYINSHVPHDGKLLMLGRGSGYFFTNRDYVADTGDDWVPYIVSEGKTPDGMLRLLHQEDFTYVVYDAEMIRFLIHGYGNHEIARDVPRYLAFQQQTLIPVASWGDIALYKVP